MIKDIVNYGDQALLLNFGNEISKEINKEVIFYFQKLSKLILENNINSIENVTPSYNKLSIQFNLLEISEKKIKEIIDQIKYEKVEVEDNSRLIKIPISYDEKFAIDLERLSKQTNISKEEIIETHLKTKFYVYMIGFMPGFPYMGDLHKKIYSKRLETPRIEIDDGSVIVAEQFCAIYPYKSPGGWNIIGKTPFKLFDQNKLSPNLINPGDEVIFEKITLEEFKKIKNDQ